jgi:tetratricopeptide (TPR) repeat protein
MSKWVAAFILIAITLSGLSNSQGQEKLQTPGELYDSGMGLFHKGKYDEAIDRFSKLILFFSTSKLHSYSRYMIGQCYLKMRKYEEAIQQLDLYLKTYPNGDRVTEAEKGIQLAKERLREKVSPPLRQPAFPDEEKKKSDEVKSYPTDKVKRRVCVQVFDLDGSLEEVEKEVKGLKQRGVDTLILRVFQNRGGRIFKFVTRG